MPKWLHQAFLLKCQKQVKEFRIIMLSWITVLSIVVCLPYTTLAIEADPLKDMDLNSLTEETSVEEKTKVLSISGYLESRNQLRVKGMDEPISLRQRLWLDCCLGQDWIRGWDQSHRPD
ncbi:MAG: hypothetical protein LWW98_07315 [Deltaproteobacteria bacterium]|nr:hypothetical protein [Deltaproteobacteria bacterium]